MNKEQNIAMNRDYVLESVSEFGLNHVFMQQKKDSLMQKASANAIVGRSKMNKSDLVSALKEAVVQPEALQEMLLLMHSDEFSFYQELLASEAVTVSEFMPVKFRFLIDKGVLVCVMQEGQYGYFIPLELKEALKKQDWAQVNQTRAYEQLVLDYMSAAVHLYGACKPERVVDIYNSHQADPITLQAMRSISRTHSIRQQPFVWHKKGYLIDTYYEDGKMSELEELLAKLKDKPYYLPNQEEFHAYANPVYYEMTPQLHRLKLFIQKELEQREGIASLMMGNIQLMLSWESGMEEVLNELTDRGIAFQDLNQAKKFVSLVSDAAHHTRVWSNGGYTAAELSEAANPAKTATRQHLNPVKIGRNDACYCGSGKKFKKCCSA
ncbi:SEC-C metal-binding domain-containing protein [Paenibacillus paeoniae]|uniref:SEC-C metal-binding domain-containing protein n=1 Tax=Paenibacillus paeoniae TaxID=2292705 RepID=UPI001403B2DA|nr:SEC-C metal-binding domain-containing protein [Paenibacillus paeoniae]